MSRLVRATCLLALSVLLVLVTLIVIGHSSRATSMPAEPSYRAITRGCGGPNTVACEHRPAAT